MVVESSEVASGCLGATRATGECNLVGLAVGVAVELEFDPAEQLTVVATKSSRVAKANKRLMDYLSWRQLVMEFQISRTNIL